MRRTAWGCLAAALLSLATLTVAFSPAGAAAASGATGPASAAPTPAPSPTIVSQLVDKDTMYSNTYRLSDGSYQAQIFAQPIRFKDLNGTWQDFDTSLEAAGVGVYQSGRTPVAVTIGSSAGGSPPAQLVARGYTLTWSVQDTDAGVPTAPAASVASYLGVATDTTLSYKVLNWGVEQSLSLASPAAPSSFTCTLSHPGLKLAQDAGGQWGLYAPGDPVAVFELSGITVHDSAADAFGSPAFCGAAAMTVAAGTDSSTLTYTVPASWLADKARVFPVTIDPAITLNPNAGNTTYADTYVGSNGGTHGTDTNLLAGYDSATASYNRTLVGFSLASLGRAYIHAATFNIYKSYSGGSSPLISVATMNEPWSTSSTWSSLGCVTNSFPTSFCSAPIASQQAAAGSWMSVDATAAVQAWTLGSAANNGFVCYQTEDGSQGAAYESKFYAADYSSGTYAPQLVVNYAPSPFGAASCDSSVYDPGDTALIYARVNSYYRNEVSWIELGLNLAKTDGTPYRGVVGWFKSSALVPSANWHTVTTKADGSVFAYYSDPNNPSDYGADTITLQGSGCTIGGSGYSPGYKRAGFRLTFGAAFGSQVAVSPDLRFGMGPATTTTWGSGASLSGDLGHPPVSVGWTAQPGMAFSVISTKVQTLTYSAQASSWFDSANAPDNTTDQGRGAATLFWPEVSAADGYHIYLNDGSGTYRQVGATLGKGNTLWSSAGQAFYPGDSEIAGLSSPANAFYRATTPSDGAGSGATVTPSTLQATISPSPVPSPTASPGCGITLADGASGQYVYEIRTTSYPGPTVWTKIGTGNGTTLGHNYGTIGPDISTMGGNCRTAFYLNGYLYDGAPISADSSSATVVGANASSGTTQNFSFTGGSPLSPSTGAPISSAGSHVLLFASAVDALSVPHVYSVAYTLSTNASGDPHYDGYRIREYDQSGAFVADHVVSMVNGASSEQAYGVLADGNFLYMIAWNGSSPAHITKISTATWQIVNQWGLDDAQTPVYDGCYDQVNDCFWLGARSLNSIYKYAGSGGTTSPGFDLRDNPNALYQKTANGSQYGRWTAYDFIVVPYSDSGGVSSEFAPPTPGAYEVAATLDNRTYSSNDDPVHTTTDLGSWDNHDVSARLDTGALQADTTDLSIATWGPNAAVSRTYLSSRTTASRFAPGWVFNFDQHLDLSQVGSGVIDYYDATGDKHHFQWNAATSAWTAPGGFLGKLAQPSSWTITYPDGIVDTYSSTGVWQGESDRNGNTTTYTWNAGNLTITAANGQTIAVTCNTSGQITRATYTTTAGTREIDYQTASPWQVTYYTGSAVQRYVTYGYTSSRLSAINQLNWPSSGQTASEAFLYSSGSLSEVHFPDYNATTKPDARATIAYLGGANPSATITRYGTVAGTANQPTKVETDSWSDQSGAQETAIQASANDTESSTTQFASATNNQLADTLTLATDSSNETTQQVSACDAAGNTTAESNDSGVGIQTCAYTDSANPNLPTQVTDPEGNATTSSYDSHGDLMATQQTLNASGDVSATQYSYDGQGRATEQKQLISGSVSSGTYATTDYSNFASNGSPQTTIDRGVQLTYGGASNDLYQYSTYDPFGDLLTQTDLSGTRTTATDTYDLAGEQLTATDGYSITSNSSYDCLGNVTANWHSVSGSAQKDNWTTTTYDPMGRALAVTTKLSDSSGNSTTQDVTSNTWDGVGNELTSTSSTLGGQAAKWTYDDQGNIPAQWNVGVYDYSAGRGTQDSYDDQGNILSETTPGNTAATTYSYNPDGSTAQQDNPDGSFTADGYDANGNKTSETVPLHGYGSNNNNVAVTGFAYDNANRLTATTLPDTTTGNPTGLTTTNGYDELSRQISAQGGSDPATNTTYNTVGWVLRKVDGDGVTDSKTYDVHGCVTSETIGTKTTGSTYDTGNRLKTQTDADSNLLTNTYDVFGNLTEAKHQSSSGAVLKDVSTTPDSLGRPTTRTDSVSGLSRTWTYPVNSAGGIQETVHYDATPLTSVAVNRNARNMETSRVATIATGNTVTRAVADSTAGRDNADRWTAASLQESGYPQLSLGRSFDYAGRLSSQSGAGYTTSNSASYAYDPDTGLRSSDSLPLLLGGTVTGSYSYDANQRLSTGTVNGVAGSYTYDTLGNLKTDTEGSTSTTFSYNSANQLTQSVVGSNTTLYGWDASNAWRTSQGPSANPNQTTYAYNAQGRMTNFANGSISEVGHATATGTGTAVSITPGVSTQAGDVVLAVIHANTTGNTITDNNGANTFTSDIQENTASTSRYAIVHRIAVASEPASYAWTLSSSQNWSVEVRVFRGVASSVWDVAPSTTTRTMGTSGTTATAPSMTTTSPGALGVLICLTDTSGGTTYSSATNGYGTQVTPGTTQLQSSWTRTWSTPGPTGTSAATKSASNDWVAQQVALKPAATTASYAYDAAGQRSQSTVSVAGVTTTTNWTYDGITLMGLSAVQGSSSWRVDYLYDEGGTPYGAVYRSPATSTSPTYFTTITNDRGDVVELLDANGAAFADYHYDAWGLPTATTTQATTLITASLAANIASRQVLRYASYAYDAESGLYYCSARYYDPVTRQWTTADPAKADGEESGYQYCEGNPVSKVDPNGCKKHYLSFAEITSSYYQCTGTMTYEQDAASNAWYVDKVTWEGYFSRANNGDTIGHVYIEIFDGTYATEYPSGKRNVIAFQTKKWIPQYCSVAKKKSLLDVQFYAKDGTVKSSSSKF